MKKIIIMLLMISPLLGISQSGNPIFPSDVYVRGLETVSSLPANYHFLLVNSWNGKIIAIDTLPISVIDTSIWKRIDNSVYLRVPKNYINVQKILTDTLLVRLPKLNKSDTLFTMSGDTIRYRLDYWDTTGTWIKPRALLAINNDTYYMLNGIRILSQGAGGIFLGHDAGTLTSGIDNTAIGPYTLYLNTTGRENTIVGASSFKFPKFSSYNTTLGVSSGINTKGNHCLYLGSSCMASTSDSVDGRFVVNMYYQGTAKKDRGYSLLYGIQHPTDSSQSGLRLNGNFMISTVPTSTSSTVLVISNDSLQKRLVSGLSVQKSDTATTLNGYTEADFFQVGVCNNDTLKLHEPILACSDIQLLASTVNDSITFRGKFQTVDNSNKIQGWDTTDILQHTDTSMFSFNSVQSDTSLFSWNSVQSDTSLFSWSSNNLQGHDTNWVINMKHDSVWNLITATNADIDTLINSIIATGNITADTLNGYTSEKLHFATIYDTTTQTFASTTKAYPLTFNCNGAIYGITHTAGDSIITVANSATYKFLVSSIADMTIGTNGKLEIWFRLNDVDVPYSNTIVNIPSSVETTLVVEMILVLHAGDKVKLMRRASDTNVRILFTTKGTSPIRPATPSSILTVLKVSKYH